MAFKNLTPWVFPRSISSARSSAVPSVSRRGRGTPDDPSPRISSLQVAGVSRAFVRASPLSVKGLGLPRLTSTNSSALVKNELAAVRSLQTARPSSPLAILAAACTGWPDSSVAIPAAMEILRNCLRLVASLMACVPFWRFAIVGSRAQLAGPDSVAAFPPPTRNRSSSPPTQLVPTKRRNSPGSTTN